MIGTASTRRALSDRTLGSVMAAAQDGDTSAYRQILALAALRAMEACRQHGPARNADAFACRVLQTVHAARATYDPKSSFNVWLSAIISAHLPAVTGKQCTMLQAARADSASARPIKEKAVLF